MKTKHFAFKVIAAVIILVCIWLYPIVMPRHIPDEFSPDIQDTIEHSTSMFIYSLDPLSALVTASPKSTTPVFHEHSILKSKKVVKSSERERIVDSLYRSIGKAEQASCFNPRHGLRFMKGPQTVDIVICFECANVMIYNGNQDRTSPAPISNYALPILDGILSSP